MELNLKSVQVHFHSHVTEDAERTLQVVSEVLRIPLESFSQAKTEGYFRNPILIYSARLMGGSVRPLVEYLFSQLDPLDKSTLRREISTYVDDRGDLHLRLDKQSLFSGNVKLSTSDVVWVKVKGYFRGSREELLSSYLSLL